MRSDLRSTMDDDEDVAIMKMRFDSTRRRSPFFLTSRVDRPRFVYFVDFCGGAISFFATQKRINARVRERAFLLHTRKSFLLVVFRQTQETRSSTEVDASWSIIHSLEMSTCHHVASYELTLRPNVELLKSVSLVLLLNGH